MLISPPGLGELDDALEGAGHPVHVLGAGVHRDARTGREGVPLERAPAAAPRGRCAAMTRAHSASATEPSDRSGSPLSTTRVTPCGWRTVGELTTATMMPALLRPKGRSTGTSTPVSSRSCSTTRAAVAGDHRLQLVGVDEAATAGPHDLRGVVVEGLERLGRAARRRCRRPRSRAGSRSGPRSAAGASSGRGRDVGLHEHLLDAGAGGERGDAGLQRGELAEVGLDGGPDLHPDVVHVELGAARARGWSAPGGPPRGSWRWRARRAAGP